MLIAAVLPPYQFDFERTVVIQHRVIERQIALWTAHHLSFDILPDHAGSQFLPLQIAFHRIVAKTLAVISKIRQRVVGLRHQQKLTIVEAGYGSHSFRLSSQPFSRSFA